MLHSYNEWDPLREIVVGTATGANWPSNDPVFSQEHLKTTWKETPVPSGEVPPWVIEEANEDLQRLATTLVELGIIVHRPSDMDFVKQQGFYNYCPRDRLIVAGDSVIDTPMLYPCRDMEIEALNVVTSRAKKVYHMPRNAGMVLDAANVLRLNDEWLYLVSESGNIEALQWLRKNVPNVSIEPCSFYSGVHIDSTITIIREGLVVLNGSRVNHSNCPQIFDGWLKIYVNDVLPQDFFNYPYASKWIALNMLTVDSTTVIVDKWQTKLIRELEDLKITVIPLELRHSRTLGGGFHCVTLDLVRRK
jgi:scyllo-inosamine-4-phosphate amidinotransferase 1|tara:strand:+ start:272 stop:1186 length:915 start_codon:yes stop_codon:yes gene_type:complete